MIGGDPLIKKRGNHLSCIEGEGKGVVGKDIDCSSQNAAPNVDLF